MFLGFILLFLFLTPCCDSLEDGWKGIKPLHTSRKVVEKVLGQAKVDDNGHRMYSTAEAYVQVDYTVEPCSDNGYERGRYKLPINTVFIYRVILKNKRKISELEFDREKFHRETAGHVLNYASYVNSDDSVEILLTILPGNEELVYEIDYRPTTKDLEKLACKELS